MRGHSSTNDEVFIKIFCKIVVPFPLYRLYSRYRRCTKERHCFHTIDQAGNVKILWLRRRAFWAELHPGSWKWRRWLVCIAALQILTFREGSSCGKDFFGNNEKTCRSQVLALLGLSILRTPASRKFWPSASPTYRRSTTLISPNY